MRDREEIQFQDQDQMLQFFREQKESDVWVRVYTNELSTLPLDNMPLFAGQIMEELNIDVSEEAVKDCMGDMQMMLKFPSENKLLIVPIRYTALKTLCDRAGISGLSITSYDERPYHSVLTPAERAETLSMCLRHFKNRSLVLLRDEKISAVMSGDEKDYSVMPVADLMEILMESLQERFENYKFVVGITSHEMTKADFDINDETMAEEFKEKVGETEVALDVSNVIIRLQLVTSDVGRFSATLIPSITMGNVSVRIGEPLKLRHKGCEVSEFADVCEKIFSMFKDGMKRMEEMASIPIRDCSKALEDMAKRADLPIKGIKAAQEAMVQECGVNCTGFELFYYMYWIIDYYCQYMEEKGQPLTLQQRFDMQEKAARELRMFDGE